MKSKEHRWVVTVRCDRRPTVRAVGYQHGTRGQVAPAGYCGLLTGSTAADLSRASGLGWALAVGPSGLLTRLRPCQYSLRDPNVYEFTRPRVVRPVVSFAALAGRLGVCSDNMGSSGLL